MDEATDIFSASPTPSDGPARPRTRAALAGVSLLVLLALALNATAGLIDPAVFAVCGPRETKDAARFISQAIVRRMAVRRETTKDDPRPEAMMLFPRPRRVYAAMGNPGRTPEFADRHLTGGLLALPPPLA